MCGRYSQTSDLATLMRRFKTGLIRGEVRPRYNIAPSQPALVVIQEAERTLDLYRWGLIPWWTKDPKAGAKMINARAETVADRPAFKRPFQGHRCLVPADGFYEWRTDPTREARIPMRVELKTHEPFAFAGVWDAWRDAEGRETRSFAILTTAANELVATIHDRMPAILRPEDEDVWLDPSADPAALKRMLVPYAGREMRAYVVSTAVNSPRNDTPACIAPAQGAG
jgi:putative SOS response-associated peptidase YedK